MESNTPFLRQIADAYVDGESANIDRFCFVTPNKRSATFLRKEFGDRLATSVGSALMPEITTISDLLVEWTDMVEASQFEMLFILYNVYSDVVARHATADMIAAGEHIVDFNKFQYWGGILISDFNDVDKYLVDAQQLFRNVATLKEISANYLTPNQIDVIKRYWNESDVPQPVKDFWNHVVYRSGREQGGKNGSGFLRLWQVMHEIYVDFRAALKDRGMSYPGMMYRDVCDRMRSMGPEDFEYDKYVFVGFNVLSASERKIFARLKAIGIADFYWDVASPVFKIPTSTAMHFMRSQLQEFPSKYDHIGHDTPSWPQTEVIAVPSCIGQTKVVAEILRGIHPELYGNDGLPKKDVSQEALFDTAIVLPDEKVCLPLLHGLPEGLDELNVTMGFPIRHTPVYSLLRNIVSMQLRARMVRGEYTIYYEDVIAVITHPIVRMAARDVCDELMILINRNRLFNIPVSTFYDPRFEMLAPIFHIVDELTKGDPVFTYLEGLIRWLKQQVSDRQVVAAADGPSAQVFSLEMGFLLAYEDAIAELRRLDRLYLRDRSQMLADKTVFHLVERILGQKTVSFDGEPLKGLQIMGVLETRNLDFDNVVILSMNERIFPRRHYSKSMIPHALRSAYGMAVLEHQESIFSYYFYRMISRAKRVFLVYDGRNQGTKSGRPSRYINQIRFLCDPDRLRYSPKNYDLMPDEPLKDVVWKTDKVMDQLRLFTIEGSKRNLSASALATYITCPLQFYLTYVEQFREPDEVKDYMDDSTYGTIVHETIQRIYEEERNRVGKPLPVDKAMLDRISREELIYDYLTKSIKANYLKIDEDAPVELEGDSDLLRKIMVKQISNMFMRERRLLPFSFFEAEAGRVMQLRVNHHKVNFSYRIDRVDFVDEKDGERFVRLIDFKTGVDDNKADTVQGLFAANDDKIKSNNKALLQLLLYCNAYAQDNDYKGRIEPMLYRLRKLAFEPISHFTFSTAYTNTSNRVPLRDYRTINDEYLDHLTKLLDELFDREKPFEPRPSDGHCKFCMFKQMCACAVIK